MLTTDDDGSRKDELFSLETEVMNCSDDKN